MKKTRYFLHWYRTDFGRKVVVLVGDPKAASREIHRNFPKDVGDMLVSTFREAYDGYDWNGLCNDESGREKKCAWGYQLVWFPVVPKICVLVHELLHATQDICSDLNIFDREFEAYTLDMLVEYFRVKLESDRKKPYDNKLTNRMGDIMTEPRPGGIGAMRTAAGIESLKTMRVNPDIFKDMSISEIVKFKGGKK